MKRREFLKVVGGATGAYAFTPPSILALETAQPVARSAAVAGLPRRILGRTGRDVSIVGFPGLALIHQDQTQGSTAIMNAFERGVNYFDVAPAYGNGDAEKKMGVGLQGIARDQIFLACKTNKRDAAGAREELERSLKRLKTDHIDLYQMHHLRSPEEVHKALGPGGALETFVKAKEEGKVKHLGFSAHTTKGALLAMNGFQFDTVMFPINFIEYFTIDFGQPILELAKKQGAAVAAIKPMCRGGWPEGMERTRKWWYRPVEQPDEVSLALRFTLSRPGVVVGFPPAFLDLLDRAIDAAKNYEPSTESEIEKLQKLAAECLSIFKQEEDRVALKFSPGTALFAGSPYEGCCGRDV